MIAISTIAMSAYNILAMARGPASVAQIEKAFAVYEVLHATEDLQAALQILVSKGWVLFSGEDEVYYLKDKHSRQAISRLDSGNPGDDGWLDWKVGDAVRGIVPINEAIR